MLHYLPLQVTPFIGREEDVVRVAALLVDPACRLLTLFGPGGIGKTRLSLQAAAGVADAFAHGVCFISLQPLESTDFLVSTMADALKLSLRGQADLRVQLLKHLADKEMLLLMDNFEHLLADSLITALLTEILENAPSVKFLVTSREVLNLQEEWLYPVRGMSFPTSPEEGRVEKLEAYGAVRLFVERARQVHPQFSLAAEQADVIRICRLVEGTPLALELAASWTRTLSCRVIADEIQRNINFLDSNLRNVPERHQSMRAVFRHSWQLLAEKERGVFMRLSVFKGGFRREAAERIAGASLATLSALVDKSLLRSEPDGRYQLHELLRQYAVEQLAYSPEDVVGTIYDLHCAYYADFFYQRQADLVGGRQLAALAEIESELENIRAAWQWALAGSRVAEIEKSSHGLSLFHQFKSRYREGIDTLEKAIPVLSKENGSAREKKALAMVLLDVAWFCMRLGWLAKAEQMASQSQAIYTGLNIPPPPGHSTDPLVALGIIASIYGDYAEAARLGAEARRVNEANGHLGNLPFAFYLQARAALAQGDYELAQDYARQACTLVEKTGDDWFRAYCLNELGTVAGLLGNFAEARQHYQTSYRIREEFADLEGMALALNHLGKIAALEDDYAEARRLYQESLAIYQQVNDRGGLATSLYGLGTVAARLGEHPAARQFFQQALQVAAEIQFVPLTLSILIGVAELLAQTGEERRGLELLALAYHHPASDRETRDQARRGLDHYETLLPAELFTAGTQTGQQGDLPEVIRTLQAELAAPVPQTIPEPVSRLEAAAGAAAPVGHRRPLPEQPLVEPLTARELEVLELIAQGLTNQQMADRLIISTGTVKWYTSQIYSKLNVSSRTQAVARARELKLLV